MAKTATATVSGPVAARVAVLERVKARRPPDKVRTYPNLDGGEPFVSRVPAAADRLPPRTLQDWIDDRVIGAFGGRTGLNPGEQAVFTILEAMRSGDSRAVQGTVKTAGAGLDDRLRHLVCQQLESWRSAAPGFALDMAIAATGEARRHGWDRPPRRRSRAPEPVSQVPGERVA